MHACEVLNSSYFVYKLWWRTIAHIVKVNNNPTFSIDERYQIAIFTGLMLVTSLLKRPLGIVVCHVCWLKHLATMAVVHLGSQAPPWGTTHEGFIPWDKITMFLVITPWIYPTIWLWTTCRIVGITDYRWIPVAKGQLCTALMDSLLLA